MEKTVVFHPFEPIYSSDSRILILGTIPSPKSRENAFYYGHPQNRFWKVLTALFGEKTPASNEEKTAFCIRHKIALWDVLSSCEIKGAADSSIKNPVANDIPSLIEKTEIKAIFATGKTAAKYYTRLCEKEIGIEITTLPSTSPANAAWNFDRLFEAYSVILKYL